MKIKELLIMETEQPGTFVGIHLAEETLDHIKEYMDKNKIQNALTSEKLHITLLYSKKPCPNYKAARDIYPITAKSDRFDIWTSTHIEGNPNCLVLKIDCPEIKERNQTLMTEHEATSDFPDYKPHLTFSYDAGDIKVDDLPEFNNEIILIREYKEDLRAEYKKDD